MTTFFNVATNIEQLDDEPGFGPPVIHSYGGKSLHEQSHGELFLTLLTERFGGQGLYLLDEPEAALSPQCQLAALARIHDLVEDQSQFIMRGSITSERTASRASRMKRRNTSR